MKKTATGARPCQDARDDRPQEKQALGARNELKDTDVTVTYWMPGAIETEFFEHAQLMDTKVGTARKDDPAEVARQGFDAMIQGDGQVIIGWDK